MSPQPTPRRELLLSGSAAFPLGNNQLPLVTNYNQRVKYREGDYFFDLPEPIDTFYDKVFYGKVDNFQNVIVPKKNTNLIKQTSDSSNVFCFDFVADAFFKLKRNLKIAGDSGGIEKIDTKFYEISPTAGWFNYEPEYKETLRYVFSAYGRYLNNLDKREFNKVRTIKDYCDGLVDYLKVGDYKLPITLTEYILSVSTPYTISGIVLELAEESYSDDLNKFTNYFLDINFAYYTRAARKFGFYVDRNGPWRLFADVFSVPMLEELNKFGVNKQNFFDNYFDRTYTLDMQLFQTELIAAYNTFANNHYLITESTIPTLACPVSRITTIGRRQQSDTQEINDFGNEYWLGTYFNIRMLESGIKYKNATTLIKESVKVDNVYGNGRGLVYINNLFKPYLYDERLFNKNFLTSGDRTVRIGSSTDTSTFVVGSEGTSY